MLGGGWDEGVCLEDGLVFSVVRGLLICDWEGAGRDGLVLLRGTLGLLRRGTSESVPLSLQEWC